MIKNDEPNKQNQMFCRKVNKKYEHDNNLVSVFVRNYQKKAIKLTLEKKFCIDIFRNKIQNKMHLKSNEYILFLHGKAIQNDEQSTIQLHEGLIFHIVETKRVYLQKININVRRIQPNSIIHKFNVQSKMEIKTFMTDMFSQKFKDSNQYFLAYLGKQLSPSLTFAQQYVENETQILAVHKIQNLKSQTITQKRQPISKANSVINSKNQTSKPLEKINEIFNQNYQTQQRNIPINNSINLDQRNISVMSSIKSNQDNRKQKQSEIRAEDITKFKLKGQQSIDSNIASQLCQTAKFNNQEQNQSSRQTSKFKESLNLQQTELITFQAQKNQRKSILSQNQSQQTQSFIINNNNAYSYTIKSLQKQKNNQQCQNNIATLYGVVPKKQNIQPKREAQNKASINIQFGTDKTIIAILKDDDADSINQIKSENKAEKQLSSQQAIENLKQDTNLTCSIPINPFKDSGSLSSNFMLKTISSHYDDQVESELRTSLMGSSYYQQSIVCKDDSPFKYTIGNKSITTIQKNPSQYIPSNQSLQNQNQQSIQKSQRFLKKNNSSRQIAQQQNSITQTQKQNTLLKSNRLYIPQQQQREQNISRSQNPKYISLIAQNQQNSIVNKITDDQLLDQLQSYQNNNINSNLNLNKKQKQNNQLLQIKKTGSLNIQNQQIVQHNEGNKNNDTKNTTQVGETKIYNQLSQSIIQIQTQKNIIQNNVSQVETFLPKSNFTLSDNDNNSIQIRIHTNYEHTNPNKQQIQKQKGQQNYRFINGMSQTSSVYQCSIPDASQNTLLKNIQQQNAQLFGNIHQSNMRVSFTSDVNYSGLGKGSIGSIQSQTVQFDKSQHNRSNTTEKCQLRKTGINFTTYNNNIANNNNQQYSQSDSQHITTLLNIQNINKCKNTTNSKIQQHTEVIAQQNNPSNLTQNHQDQISQVDQYEEINMKKMETFKLSEESGSKIKSKEQDNNVDQQHQQQNNNQDQEKVEQDVQGLKYSNLDQMLYSSQEKQKNEDGQKNQDQQKHVNKEQVNKIQGNIQASMNVQKNQDSFLLQASINSNRVINSSQNLLDSVSKLGQLTKNQFKTKVNQGSQNLIGSQQIEIQQAGMDDNDQNLLNYVLSSQKKNKNKKLKGFHIGQELTYTLDFVNDRNSKIADQNNFIFTYNSENNEQSQGKRVNLCIGDMILVNSRPSTYQKQQQAQQLTPNKNQNTYKLNQNIINITKFREQILSQFYKINQNMQNQKYSNYKTYHSPNGKIQQAIPPLRKQMPRQQKQEQEYILTDQMNKEQQQNLLLDYL